MNILFFHRLGINPTGGGVSQITHVLDNEFSIHGYKVYYLGFQTVDGMEYTDNQFFLPNNSDLICEENIDYLNSFCRERKIDVVINQNGLYLESVAFVAKAEGVLRITVIHNCIFTQFRNLAYQHEYKLKQKNLGWLFNVAKLPLIRNVITWVYIQKYSKYYKQIADNSDYISVMSQGQVDDLKIVLNKSRWNRIVLIPNCITPYSLQWGPRSKTVLWVATIDFKIKRVDLMLKIWKQVQNNHPDWTLKILGDSPYSKEAKDYAQQLGVNNVCFAGRVDPLNYYLDAQIACVTSTHESFSMVIIESFKFGVVPMAFDSFPAAKELIDNGKDGFVIPAFDVNEYAKKLCQLMDRDDTRENMRKNAYASAQKYFSSGIFEKWKDLLERA